MNRVRPFDGHVPEIDPRAFIAPSADVIGDVVVGPQSSIWFGTVLRGDTEPIRIGARTSIQDNSVLHTTGGWAPTVVGDDCTVGHAVILHGCTVGSRVLVGMGAVILDGATIHDDVLIGAGSLITSNTEIPSGVLAFGRPAKVVRPLTDRERESIAQSARTYVEHTAQYLLNPP